MVYRYHVLTFFCFNCFLYFDLIVSVFYVENAEITYMEYCRAEFFISKGLFWRKKYFERKKYLKEIGLYMHMYMCVRVNVLVCVSNIISEQVRSATSLANAALNSLWPSDAIWW